MYEVVYMKADFEPWWMFEEWRDFEISAETFSERELMDRHVRELIDEMQGRFEFHESRKGCFHAFWSTAEKHFCEGCEGDLQIYHGLVVLHNGKPLIS